MFDPNANPEDIASRAAELAIEQHDRLHGYLKNHPGRGAEFYKDNFEVGISNDIARLMNAYAVLTGIVPLERVTRK